MPATDSVSIPRSLILQVVAIIAGGALAGGGAGAAASQFATPVTQSDCIPEMRADIRDLEHNTRLICRKMQLDCIGGD